VIKVLLRDGVPLRLARKVFDTLLILLENGGRTVKKEELMRRSSRTPLLRKQI
jgi:DNA-binding response OmpR family regulator